MTPANEHPNAQGSIGNDGDLRSTPLVPAPWPRQATHDAWTNEPHMNNDEEWNRVLEEAMSMKEQSAAASRTNGKDGQWEWAKRTNPLDEETALPGAGTRQQREKTAEEDHAGGREPMPAVSVAELRESESTPCNTSSGRETNTTMNPKLAMLLQIVSLGLTTLAAHGIFVQVPHQATPHHSDGQWADDTAQEHDVRDHNTCGTAKATLSQTMDIDTQYSPPMVYQNEGEGHRQFEVDNTDQYEAADSRPDWLTYASTARRAARGPTGGSAAATWGRVAWNTNSNENAPPPTAETMPRGAPAEMAHDHERKQSTQSRAQYLTTSGLLNVTPTPSDGFPDVHANGPEDNLRYISDERLAAYDVLPPGSACLIDLFGQGSLSEKRLKAILPRIRSAIILITGDENIRIEHPEPCPIGDTWDAPSIWIVWNLSPVAAATLIQQLVWDTALASFRIVPRAPLPPRYLFAVLNLKSDRKKPEAIRASLLTVMLFGEAYEITKNAIAKDRTSRFQSPETGAAIVANSLFVDTVNMGGDLYTCISGSVARIYCDPPTFDSDIWSEWRDELRTIAFPFAEGPTRTGHRCKKCHGVDHTTHLCRFDKCFIPGWYGKIIPEVERKRKGKQV